MRRMMLLVVFLVGFCGATLAQPIDMKSAGGKALSPAEVQSVVGRANIPAPVGNSSQPSQLVSGWGTIVVNKGLYGEFRVLYISPRVIKSGTVIVSRVVFPGAEAITLYAYQYPTMDPSSYLYSKMWDGRFPDTTGVLPYKFQIFTIVPGESETGYMSVDVYQYDMWNGEYGTNSPVIIISTMDQEVAGSRQLILTGNFLNWVKTYVSLDLQPIRSEDLVITPSMIRVNLNSSSSIYTQSGERTITIQQGGWSDSSVVRVRSAINYGSNGIGMSKLFLPLITMGGGGAR